MEGSGTVVAQQPAQKSSLPLVGGILLILTAIMGLAMWGLIIAGGSTLSNGMPGVPADYVAMAQDIVPVCGAIEIIFCIIALLGGIMAVQRKSWGLALVGSILGLFTLGYLLGSVLSLIALILIAVAKKDFA